jgi:hypothetical protein
MKNNILLAVTCSLIILFISIHSHAQWTLVGVITGSPRCISVAGPNMFWAAGGLNGQPKVYRYSNGSGHDASGNLTGNELYSIWGTDSNTCYAGDGGAIGGAGGNAKVWRTTNGGVNWNVLFTTGGSAGFINGICFSRTNPLVGFIESDPPSGAGGAYWIQKTTDGGTTWTFHNATGISSQLSTELSLVCIDANFYGFGTSGNTGSPYIVFTSDGGTSWPHTLLPIANPFVSGFAMASDKINGIAVNNTLPQIARTTNGGATFSIVTGASGVTGFGTCKWVYGTQYVYICGTTGSAGVAEESTDGGQTWSQMTTPAVVDIVHMELVYVGGQITAYALASDGTVIKLQKFPSGIDPNNNSVPTSYKLEQNYPNPFNPTTNIRYSLPKASNVTVKIFDILGHEVMTVVNAYQNAGNYVETVNASSLASGVYFYTIKADNFTETKKMSLVK